MVDTPLGIIPTLETSDGKVISGNSAISRYLAEKYGIYYINYYADTSYRLSAYTSLCCNSRVVYDYKWL